MFDKIKRRLFQSDKVIEALKDAHSKSIGLNKEAKEKLLSACDTTKTAVAKIPKEKSLGEIIRIVG